MGGRSSKASTRTLVPLGDPGTSSCEALKGKEALNVNIFTFNTEAVTYCRGTVSPYYRKGYSSCVSPDFTEALVGVTDNFVGVLIVNHPELIVIALQEAAPASGLVRDQDAAISEALLVNGYQLISSEDAMGLGQELVRGLRTAVYARKDMLSCIEGVRTRRTFCQDRVLGITTSRLRNKGAIITDIDIVGVGRLSIANVHLPFHLSTFEKNEEGIIMRRNTEDPLFELQVNCLVQVADELLADEEDLHYAGTIQSALIVGDVNARDADGVALISMVNDLMRSETSKFQEKLHGYVGPSCKYCKLSDVQKSARGCGECSCKIGDTECKRDDTCLIQERPVGKCDRVFYTEPIEALQYERFDFGNIKASDHSGVYAHLQWPLPEMGALSRTQYDAKTE